MNFSKNASQLFKSDDCCPSNGANQANVMFDNKMPMSSTQVGQFG